MKRKGVHRPTIEDAVEISGIETLHPGGFELTRRTAQLTKMQPESKVLDVSSGRGTQAIYYAEQFGAKVTGVDLSPEMVATASRKATESMLSDQVAFVLGDSQELPFDDAQFDIVINECAVGIPDDSQAVLNEMVRVSKPGGAIAIHESTWVKHISDEEKAEISERYGTTPLDFDEWVAMLMSAGVKDIVTEFEEWSKPEMFWNVRADRKVESHKKILTKFELMQTAARIVRAFGIRGLFKLLENERIFYQTVLNRKLGYCLFKGVK